MYKKGESGNRKGRPKGAVGACTKAKNDYFKVYQKLGGIKGLLKFIKEKDLRQHEFYLKVLPTLMPKKTDIDGKLVGTVIIKIKGKEDKGGDKR